MCEVMRKYEKLAREEGKAEGIMQEKMSNASALLKKGLDKSIISSCLDIPMNQLNQLEAQMQ